MRDPILSFLVGNPLMVLLGLSPVGGYLSIKNDQRLTYIEQELASVDRDLDDIYRDVA